MKRNIIIGIKNTTAINMRKYIAVRTQRIILETSKDITVGIDVGHGPLTRGKRTPRWENGKFMHEYEFNLAVAKKLERKLIKRGFKVVRTYKEGIDLPLKSRVKIANDAKVDIFISIHANAYGMGGWNTVTGIETYYSTGSRIGPRLAKTVHKELIDATGMVDRKVKNARFYVIKNTDAPAILTESGFMTNKEDAKKLLDDGYREKIALAHAVGICKYFGIDYMPLFENDEEDIKDKKIKKYEETIKKQDKKINDSLAIANEISILLSDLYGILKKE